MLMATCMAFMPSLKAVMAGIYHTAIWVAMGWRASQELGHRGAWFFGGWVMQNGIQFWLGEAHQGFVPDLK
jgi:hypothetical protein